MKREQQKSDESLTINSPETLDHIREMPPKQPKRQYRVNRETEFDSDDCLSPTDHLAAELFKSIPTVPLDPLAKLEEVPSKQQTTEYNDVPIHHPIYDEDERQKISEYQGTKAPLMPAMVLDANKDTIKKDDSKQPYRHHFAKAPHLAPPGSLPKNVPTKPRKRSRSSFTGFIRKCSGTIEMLRSLNED